jgi:hypothetical protein
MTDASPLSASGLLACGHRVYLVSTGAGAGLQQRLWEIPGISKVLVGAEFPYATEALDAFLGFAPDGYSSGYCSAETALAMAMEAYSRAFSDPLVPCVGLGLTASVASNSAHRGDHRIYVATVSERGCRLHTAVLPKGAGPEARKRDGAISDELAWGALHDALEIPITEATKERLADLESHTQRECASEALAVFLRRSYISASGQREAPPPNGNGLALFPGAFHPPHDGHFWMARENGATFHITVNPPHKPALSVTDVLRRSKWLSGFPRLFTADDPLYLDKARRFPGAKFLIGVDALERMLDPSWGVETPVLLEELRRLGIRFLVADREVDGAIRSLLDLPAEVRPLAERILGPAAHLAKSSTQVRAAMGRAVSRREP